MSERDVAKQVLDALKSAEQKLPAEALPLLNGLIPLVQGGGSQELETEEARSSAFMAICEVGKALHRGQPTDRAYATAISAAERWVALAR